MLLTKLYLNADVYTGTAMYDQAFTFAEKVINDGGYTLETNFEITFQKIMKPQLKLSSLLLQTQM